MISFTKYPTKPKNLRNRLFVKAWGKVVSPAPSPALCLCPSHLPGRAALHTSPSCGVTALLSTFKPERTGSKGRTRQRGVTCSSALNRLVIWKQKYIRKSKPALSQEHVLLLSPSLNPGPCWSNRRQWPMSASWTRFSGSRPAFKIE